MNKNKEIYRIGITGSYGGLNLGDEAILQSIIEQLRVCLPTEITVFSRNPTDTLRRHKVDRSVPVRELSRSEILPEIERLDLLIFGGGGILFDAEAKLFLREVILAQEKNIPVMVYAIGAGPLRDPVIYKEVKVCLNRATAITVRDKGAAMILQDIGVKKEILITADPAFLIKPEPLPDGTEIYEHLDSGRCLIGISIREVGLAAPDIDEDCYKCLLANAADYMIERFEANVIFIPMERGTKDLQLSHAVIARMLRAEYAMVLSEKYTSGQLLSLTKYFTFAVGMRLHFLIFATLQDVPFVALPYSPKVSAFMANLGLEIPPIHLVNAGRLIAYIDHSWNLRDSMRERVSHALPEFQRRARETNNVLVNLLKGDGEYCTTLNHV